MNEQFNWRRLGLLVCNDMVKSARDYSILFAVFTIIFILNAVPAAFFGNTRDGFYYGMFGGLLLIGGSIVNSLMFKELGDKRLNDAWLLLPASALEKVLARYVHGTVIFILLILAFVTVAAMLIEGFNMLFFGRTNMLFNPVAEPVGHIIIAFLVIQPIFFLGGAWFRRARWFKTVITVSILCFVLGMLAMIASLLVFAGSMEQMYLMQGMDFSDWDVNFRLIHSAVLGLKIVCFVVLPLFSLYVTWLRVKETQVSYGI